VQPLKVVDIMYSKGFRITLFQLLLLFAGVACAADDFNLTPGGVSYRDLRVGSGAAVHDGDVVTVHLTGWVGEHGNGSTAFLNTRQERHPIRFMVGTGRVIAGWNEGVRGMQVGGRRLLRIPPQLGIGARTFEDKVPANATMVFIVELLEVTQASD
jgi:FKBP-type peptidyl-prolyl cis-trans isomerase